MLRVEVIEDSRRRDPVRRLRAPERETDRRGTPAATRSAGAGFAERVVVETQPQVVRRFVWPAWLPDQPQHCRLTLEESRDERSQPVRAARVESREPHPPVEARHVRECGAGRALDVAGLEAEGEFRPPYSIGARLDHDLGPRRRHRAKEAVAVDRAERCDGAKRGCRRIDQDPVDEIRQPARCRRSVRSARQRAGEFARGDRKAEQKPEEPHPRLGGRGVRCDSKRSANGRRDWPPPGAGRSAGSFPEWPAQGRQHNGTQGRLQQQRSGRCPPAGGPSRVGPRSGHPVPGGPAPCRCAPACPL